jgi:hypothetical protein
MMSRRAVPCWMRGWSWLLAALIFSSAWGSAFARVQTGSSCATAAHACCCGHTHPGGCACGGHGGPAAQLASLSACAGANDLPAFLLTPPPAALTSASAAAASLQAVGAASTAVAHLQPSAAPTPAPPPPQA